MIANGVCIKCCQRDAKPNAQKCEACTETQRQANVRYRKNLRARVILIYGGACICCGETIPEFLTFDHKNNDGAVHRETLGEGGMQLLRWIVQNEYPDSIQLLCWNCNAAKSLYGVCPHQKTGEN